MCGRYTITVDKNAIEHRFNAKLCSGRIDFEPTYNAAPSQLLPIITTYSPDHIVLAKWGFVPEEWTSTNIRSHGFTRKTYARLTSRRGAKNSDVDTTRTYPQLHA
jgi:putative SOS response-associated peptidase YedK